MATKDDLTAPMKALVEFVHKKGLPIWAFLLILGAVALGVLLFLGRVIMEGVPVVGPKWLIAIGTSISTVSGLVAAFAEAEPLQGKRQVSSSGKTRDNAKGIALIFVFLGGYMVSVVTILDALSLIPPGK